MRPAQLATAAALAFCAVLPAAAEQRPLLQPSRDASVVYRIEGAERGGAPGRSVQITMAWAEHGTKLRVDLPGSAGYALVDFVARRMLVVLPAQRIVLDSAFDPRLVPGFAIPETTRMTRAGAETVAGTPCTVWKLDAPDGAGDACITDTGLLLRGEGHSGTRGTGSIEALSVNWGPQPAARFTPPSDYRRLAQPPPAK